MWMLDTLSNFLTALGTSKDPRMSNQWVFSPLTRAVLETAYRVDWISRKVVDLPAQDATREWREWHAENEQIEAIEKLEKDFFLQQKLRRALSRARLYGGAALVMGVEVGSPDQELDVEKVTKDSLKFIHCVSPHEMRCGNLVEDIMSPWYGEPEYYERTITGQPSLRLHPSRVVRLIGAEVPDPQLAPEGWGDSALQAVDDALKSTGMVAGGIASMIHDAKMDVVKIPKLSNRISNQDYKDNLLNRFTTANATKSITNTLVLDADEEWERISTNFQALPDVLKIYLLIASGAADIPATRMLGQSAQGLNATGENDVRNYYDRIASEQNTVQTPVLTRLDEVIIRSALGARDENIYYEWRPLWQLTDVEKAELAEKKAKVFQIDATLGLLHEEVLRKARENQVIEDGFYPGIEDAIAEVEEMIEAGELPDPLEEREQEKQLAAEEQRAVIEATAAKAKMGGAMPPRRKAANDADAARRIVQSSARRRRLLADAKPRTLYVRRDLKNVSELTAWAAEQGFGSVVDDMHVTIAFSRATVDWMKIRDEYFGDDNSELIVPPGGPRLVEKLGNEGAVVLMFNSSRLSWRHEQIREAGASWDFPDYQPHVTITYASGDAVNLDKIEPYRGRLVFGPEIFEEIESDWRSKIKESASDAEVVFDRPFVDGFGFDYDPNQPRHPKGSTLGGQWSRGGFIGRASEDERKRLEERLRKVDAELAELDQVKKYTVEQLARTEALEAERLEIHAKLNPDRGHEALSEAKLAKARETVAKVKADLGYEPEIEIVSGEGPEFVLNGRKFRAGGMAHLSTGETKIYPDQMLSDAVAGVTAHEIMHQKYERVLERFVNERDAVLKDPDVRGKVGVTTEGEFRMMEAMKPDGTLRTLGLKKKYPIYSLLTPHEPEVHERAEEDGITDYSKEYWKAYTSGTGVVNGLKIAHHETLAEMARLHYETGVIRGKPVWTGYYRSVNKAYALMLEKDRRKLAA